MRPGDHGRDILCYPSNSSQVSASDQGRVELDLAAAIEQPWVFCVLAPEQDGQWEMAVSLQPSSANSPVNGESFRVVSAYHATVSS